MVEKPSYSEHRRHPKWQKKRLKIVEAAGFKCQECGADDVILNVHHSYYKNGRAVWDYPDESLKCLCENCHKKIQEIQNRLHQQINKLNYNGLLRLLGYALGIEAEHNPQMPIEIFSDTLAMGIVDYWKIDLFDLISPIEKIIIN